MKQAGEPKPSDILAEQVPVHFALRDARRLGELGLALIDGGAERPGGQVLGWNSYIDTTQDSSDNSVHSS
jgi:hypothetical protein